MRKEKVGGISPTCYNNIESLPRFMEVYPEATKRFIKINTHSLEYRESAKNSLSIYGNWIKGKVIKTVFLKSAKGRACLDQHTDPFMTRKNTIRFVRAGLNNPDRTIGEFIISTKSLFCCDLTHNEDGFLLLWEMIDFLIKNGYLPRIRKTKKDKVDILLGNDSEFELRVDGRVVTACNYFHDDNRFHDEVGIDEAGEPIELRPCPATTPEKAIDSLRESFTEACYRFEEKNISMAHLSIKGDRYAIGCHIHIGIGHSYTPSMMLLQILNSLIGSPTMRLNGNARGSYSGLSNYETKDYGYEYRSIPAAVLYKPELMRLCYKIALNVNKQYMEGKELTFYSGDNEKEKKIALHRNLKRWGKLTEKEVLDYTQLISSYTNRHKDVIAAWIERPKFKRKPFFNDAWNPDIKRTFLNIDIPENAIIHFFGLREDRGMVQCGFERIENYENIDHDYIYDIKANLVFGVPYETRVNGKDINLFIKQYKNLLKEV